MAIFRCIALLSLLSIQPALYTSSPTVLFILQRLQKLPATRPCVALGFGPGLTIEAALFR